MRYFSHLRERCWCARTSPPDPQPRDCDTDNLSLDPRDIPLGWTHRQTTHRSDSLEPPSTFWGFPAALLLMPACSAPRGTTAHLRNCDCNCHAVRCFHDHGSHSLSGCSLLDLVWLFLFFHSTNFIFFAHNSPPRNTPAHCHIDRTLCRLLSWCSCTKRTSYSGSWSQQCLFSFRL